MKKVSHTDEVVARVVKKFCDQVFWFRVVHNIYKELFENEDSHILMRRTAQSFFSDLNIILHNYLLLEFVKITDPATSKGHENFTINNLIKSVDWPKNVDQQLKALSEKTRAFRGYAIDARNKLLAHMDKEIFLSNRILGEFPEGEDERFLKTLEEICDVIHEVCFGSSFGTISVAKGGDVLDLRKVLRKALAFDRLFSESTGSEKANLFDYLHETILETLPNSSTKGRRKA
jgi:hypothetical protein